VAFERHVRKTIDLLQQDEILKKKKTQKSEVAEAVFFLP